MRSTRLLVLGLASLVVLNVPMLSHSDSFDDRAEAILKKMTLDEKILLIRGAGFETHAIPRLGIPVVKTNDASAGYRGPQATAFPAPIGMAASWEPKLVEKISGAIAQEMRAAGPGFLLGPGINIVRAPEGGRSFEYFGEDPILTSHLVVPYVHGAQKHGMIATTKHFMMNNQETLRDKVNVIADERTMHEIYLPGFKAAVDAGTGAIMSSYNKVNGSYMAANDALVNGLLKKEWGFKGMVMTDWLAAHDMIGTAMGGSDLEMPDGDYYLHLSDAVTSGKVPEGVIDEKVRRILRTYAQFGYLDAAKVKQKKSFDRDRDQKIALEAAQKAIVLLKNDGAVLPLQLGQIHSIAVIGPNAAVARYGGGGSSIVSPFRKPSPLEVIQGVAKEKGIEVRYAIGSDIKGEFPAAKTEWLTRAGGVEGEHGLRGEYFDNAKLEGDPVRVRTDATVDFDWGETLPDANLKNKPYSVRWTGFIEAPADGDFDLTFNADNTAFAVYHKHDGARVWLDGKQIYDGWDSKSVTEFRQSLGRMQKGEKRELKIEYHSSLEGGRSMASLGLVQSHPSIADAVEIARKSDVAILVVGDTSFVETEDRDRGSLELPGNQSELIQAVAAVNPKTVVVLQSGAPIVMSAWKSKVPAIIETWFPGQEGAYAMMDVLTGKVNPSAKLPVTFPKTEKDSASSGNFPGHGEQVEYKEGVFVGYRHFDQNSIEPEFPFGYGLSYTSFEYSGLKVNVRDKRLDSPRVVVSFDVKNSGSLAGAEIAQLYVGEREPKLPRPPKELKGFDKVYLKAGESKKMSMTLDAKAFSYFDPTAHAWKIDPAKFDILVGASSRDIRLKAELDLTSAQ